MYFFLWFKVKRLKKAIHHPSLNSIFCISQYPQIILPAALKPSNNDSTSSSLPSVIKVAPTPPPLPSSTVASGLTLSQVLHTPSHTPTTTPTPSSTPPAPPPPPTPPETSIRVHTKLEDMKGKFRSACVFVSVLAYIMHNENVFCL